MTDPAIFYDLETSDQNFIGQILNFSFICVDKNYKILDEFNGEILINKLQLPSPGAINANRIDVLKHQKTAALTEKNAAFKIAQFIDKQISINGKASLIGYNSSRFDLPFLRTTLIRNGINPYFFGKLIYRDLLHVSRKLSVSNAEFPRLEGKNPGRISLSLETVATKFGLLKGKQVHSSREDVLLTIDLAKYYKDKYGIDVRTYEAYEAIACHKDSGKGKIFRSLQPLYELEFKGSYNFPVYNTLLNADHRYALWVDLDRFEQGLGRKSISWFSQQTSSFFLDGGEVSDKEKSCLAQKALEEFKLINLRNYFEKSECDIEQDIYRLDISMINALNDLIWQSNRGDAKSKLTKEAKIIHMRHELANYEWGGKNDEQVKDKLRQYGLHRYGGKMLISKFKDNFDAKPGSENHSGLNDMIRLSASPEFNSNEDDSKLMRSLKEFYLNSDIYGLCMADLEKAA